MCPFCYIGKRRFEKALEQFPHKDSVVVEWKSFQLNPSMVTEQGKSINEYLAENKGWTIEYAQKMNQHVTDMASEEGLIYNMDKAVVANSFNAHRLVQFAKQKNLGDQMEEALFRAYFTEGINTDDKAELLKLAIAIGLNAEESKSVIDSNQYAADVENDIYQARQIGLRGVPYFVFNDHWAVSGAQGMETFAGALEKSWTEWEVQRKPVKEISEQGENTCLADGSNC
jgi:predicted DsbA family dithiol-disulfide isomerase